MQERVGSEKISFQPEKARPKRKGLNKEKGAQESDGYEYAMPKASFQNSLKKRRRSEGNPRLNFLLETCFRGTRRNY